MRKTLGWMFSLLLLAVSVSACGQGSGSGGSASPSPSSNATAGAASGSPDASVSASPDASGASDVNMPPPEKTKLTIRLNWKFKGEFTPFYVTKQKGLFEKYGLDVDVLEGTSSVQTLQVLSQNAEEIGVTSTVEPIQGIEKGMPVKMIASYMSRSPMVILSYPDNPVKAPKDLEGKSIASSVSSTFTNVYDKFLEKNGVDKSKVKLVKVETGARNTLFLNREVDAIAVFSTNEYPMFESKLGTELVPLYTADYGFDLAGLTLTAGTKFLEENPNTAKRVLAALNEGFAYTIQHPEEAAQMMKGLFPDTVDEALTVEQIKRTGELAVLKDKPFGWISEDNIAKTVDVLYNSGLIKKKLATGDYFTNQYFE